MEEKDYKFKQRFFETKYKNRRKIVFGQPIPTKEEILTGNLPKGMTYIKPKKEENN